MSIASAAPAALQRRRAYAGPALFAYGFRPFFLAAGLWGAFGILVWLPQFLGLVTLPTAFGPLDWHIHEMLYGYVAAAIAHQRPAHGRGEQLAERIDAILQRHAAV